MDKIEFRNFRKFADFPCMDLGNITMFVGGNNAGKSTIAKAIMLLSDNIKSLRVVKDSKSLGFNPRFHFDTLDPQHNLNVSDFERALHRGSKTKEIMLSATYNHCKIEFYITCDAPDVSSQGPTAPISKIVVENSIMNMVFTFDFISQKRIITEFNVGVESSSSTESEITNTKLNEYKDKLTTTTDPIEAASISAEIRKLESLIKENATQSKTNYKRVEIPFPSPDEYIGENLIIAMFHHIDKYPKLENKITDKRTKEYKDIEADKQYIESQLGLISAFEVFVIGALQQDWGEMSIYYIPAHLASQDAIYSKKDNSFLSSTIHQFYSSRINKGEEEYDFITYWMEQFGLGKDISISSVKGEAYTVDISTKDGMFPMADLGMGGIQVMTLLLRLATIMRDCKGRSFGPIIILEEPELNMHPKWQSMLLDVFYDVYERTLNGKRTSGLKLIVETHSEYLVRSSQVKVAYDPSAKDVFKVYYFPKDGVPYDMEFTASGRFVNKFDSGFYDEAGGLNLQLIKKERGIDV